MLMAFYEHRKVLALSIFRFDTNQLFPPTLDVAGNFALVISWCGSQSNTKSQATASCVTVDLCQTTQGITCIRLLIPLVLRHIFTTWFWVRLSDFNDISKCL